MSINNTYEYYDEANGVMILVINDNAEYPLDIWTRAEAKRDYTSKQKAAEIYNSILNAYIN